MLRFRADLAGRPCWPKADAGSEPAAAEHLAELATVATTDGGQRAVEQGIFPASTPETGRRLKSRTIGDHEKREW
jgi:hypothetical protein